MAFFDAAIPGPLLELMAQRQWHGDLCGCWVCCIVAYLNGKQQCIDSLREKLHTETDKRAALEEKLQNQRSDASIMSTPM